MILDPQDIINSVSAPKLIKDDFIRRGVFSLLRNGDPQAFSGGFSIVFPVNVDGDKWAFRCWHATLDGSRERFKLLSQSFKNINLPYFSEFVYVDSGIVVNGQTYPTTRMKWVEGDDLKTFIWNHHNDRDCLIRLGLDFLEMTETLHSMSIAHGDLQHANIIVDNDRRLHLIDYDSVFVPELTTIGARDIITGKPDYQHPARGKNIYANEKLDYFSEAIILCSILAIAYKPNLAEKYNVKETEGLLFSREDFDKFSLSGIYNDLSGLPSCVTFLRTIIERYLAEDDINKFLPIEKIQLLINSSNSIKQYIRDSETEYQSLLKKREKYDQERQLELARLKQDHDDWITACRVNNEYYYRNYLRNHPNGVYSVEAQSCIDKIIKRQKESADKQLWVSILEAKRILNDSKDRDDWEKALNMNTEHSISSYLSIHPDGKYAAKARRWLESYKKEEDKWSYALKYRTLNAYTSYLSEYPAGRHSKYAKALIDKEHEKDTIKCFSIVGAMVFIIIAYIITCVKLTESSYYNESYQNEPQQQEVYHQQYTPEEIKSITTQLDKKLKGLEQAKKDGIPRNTMILNDAEVLLERLNGTTEYEKYKQRLVVVRNN